MNTEGKKLDNPLENIKAKDKQLDTKLKESSKSEPVKTATPPKPAKEEVIVQKEEPVKVSTTPEVQEEPVKTLTAKEVKANLGKQVFPELPDSHPLKCNLCGSRPLSSGNGTNRTYRCPYNYPTSKCPSIRKFNIQQALKEKE